jgi:hypothetical protein
LFQQVVRAFWLVLLLRQKPDGQIFKSLRLRRLQRRVSLRHLRQENLWMYLFDQHLLMVSRLAG